MKHILVMFETNSGYGLGEIYPKIAINFKPNKERLKKKNIESVIMIIPRRTPPPSFLRTVIALGYLFLQRVLIN